MPRYKLSKALRSWLANKSVVIAGYCDEVKFVNLDYLLATWIDTTEENMENFGDNYPCAADYFQVSVVEKNDPRLEEPGILLRVLNDFRHFPHLKVWSDGEVMDDEDVCKVIERINASKEIADDWSR